MAVLSVGLGKPYSTIAAAVAAAQSGDTVEVQAGTYTNQYVSINKNITLQGVGGMVKMVSTGLIPNGKGIFITNGNVTINNFEFSGATVSAYNGAGIRYESGNLVLNNSYFHHNENGLLGAANATGSNTINNNKSGSPLAVKNATTTTAQITGNSFHGLTASQIASGPNAQTGNQFLATEPPSTRPLPGR